MKNVLISPWEVWEAASGDLIKLAVIAAADGSGNWVLAFATRKEIKAVQKKAEDDDHLREKKYQEELKRTEPERRLRPQQEKEER